LTGTTRPTYKRKAHDISEQNKTIARRWIGEIVGKVGLDLADEFFTGEFNWTSPLSAEAMHGPAAMRQMVTAFRTAFPDLTVDVQATMAEGTGDQRPDGALASARVPGSAVRPVGYRARL
jgi:SnoaL-like polyketide cyclase